MAIKKMQGHRKLSSSRILSRFPVRRFREYRLEVEANSGRRISDDALLKQVMKDLQIFPFKGRRYAGNWDSFVKEYKVDVEANMGKKVSKEFIYKTMMHDLEN